MFFPFLYYRGQVRLVHGSGATGLQLVQSYSDSDEDSDGAWDGRLGHRYDPPGENYVWTVWHHFQSIKVSNGARNTIELNTILWPFTMPYFFSLSGYPTRHTGSWPQWDPHSDPACHCFLRPKGQTQFHTHDSRGKMGLWMYILMCWACIVTIQWVWMSSSAVLLCNSFYL